MRNSLPCSLVEVPFSGQFANTNSATHVRLFLPCNRKVQSRRERSRAFCVSSLTPLQGGILVTKESTLNGFHTAKIKHKAHAARQGGDIGVSNYTSRHRLQRKDEFTITTTLPICLHINIVSTLTFTKYLSLPVLLLFQKTTTLQNGNQE